jgi:mono/diheme cytochrome c family protein
MEYAFFIFCAVVAVAIWIAATGGARRQAMPGESRLTNRAILLAVVIAFAFGLVAPLLVLIKNGDSKASTAVGVHLSHKEIKGRELFATSCALCHTLKAVHAVGRIGPILDLRVPEEPTVEARKELVLSAILEGRSRGSGNMPAKLYEGAEAKDIAEFVAAVAGHK